MAIRVMTLVWDSDVQAPERFTLLALADRADDEGKCWPSVRWLSRKCQTSERTIRRHLSWLESENLVRRSMRLNDSSVYRIQIKALTARALPDDPCQSGTPGQDDPPVNVSGGARLSGGTDRPGVTDQVDDPCQIDPQSFIHPSTTTSPSTPAPRRAEPEVSPAVEALCVHLRDRIVEQGSKATISKAWRDAARRMLDIDKRDATEAHRLIDWCQADSFWMTNILSMPKFREKYDQLRLKAIAGRHLSAVQARPAASTLAEFRERVDARGAARLLGIAYVPEPQPPRDQTPADQWDRQQALAFLDTHAAAIDNALRRAG